MASVRTRPSRRSSRPFVPSRDEIEAGLRGAFELLYKLTPAGAARWEKVVRVDWSRYLSSWSGNRYCSVEAQSREYLEYWIEVERAKGQVAGRVAWTKLRPWRPVYWKELPSGYRARYRLAKEDAGTAADCWVFPLPPWGLGYTPKFHHGPTDLAPRKERRAAERTGETARAGGDDPYEYFRRRRNDRERFAAGCEYAAQADRGELQQLLRFRHAEVRFAAVRELALRKERAAVPQLIGLVLREQYLPALWALGEIGDESALPVLEMLMQYEVDFTGPMCGTLIRAIAQFGDAPQPLPDPTQAPSGRRAEERFARVSYVAGARHKSPVPDDPVAALVNTLTHPDCSRRRAAVDLLVELGARDHRAAIGRLAQDPQWEVRASVAHALQQWNASPKLLGLLAKDPNPAVRWLARNRALL